MCEACVENLRAHARLLRTTEKPAPLGPKPTAAALERHARKFGPEGVAETAAELGVDIKVARPKALSRARRPSLKARVAVYVAAGHSAAVIAEMENLTPGRARRLVEEVQ